MPIFDFVCWDCEIIDERLLLGEETKKTQFCEKCHLAMHKLPPLSRFKLIYNNKTDIVDWDGNKSHFWDKYKEEKAKGNNVELPEKYRQKWK